MFSLFVIQLLFFCSFSSHVYVELVEYRKLENLCDESATTLFIPIQNELSSNETYSLCTTFFSKTKSSLRIIYHQNQPLETDGIVVQEFDDGECNHKISEVSFLLGRCYGNSTVFGQSKFYVHDKSPSVLESVENGKDYLVTETYENDECQVSEFESSDLVKTNILFGKNKDLKFRCNESISTTTYLNYGNITKVQTLDETKCVRENSNNSLIFRCVDYDYLQDLKSECSASEFFYVNVYRRESNCTGEVLQQLIIKNGLCFYLNSYEYKTYSQYLMKDIQEKYGVLEIYKSSVSQNFGGVIDIRGGKIKISYFEIYDNKYCHSNTKPILAKFTSPPRCSPVDANSDKFTTEKDKSLLQTEGRIAIIPTDSCHKTKEEYENIIRDTILDNKFEYVTSITARKCINSDFGFFYSDEPNWSMFGDCVNYQPTFQVFKRSGECKYESKVIHNENYCIDHTNYNNNGSSIVTCIPIYCFRKSIKEADVCSGHGSCIGHDNCDCKTPYFGRNCDKSIVTVLVISFSASLFAFCCICCVPCCLIICCCCFTFCCLFTRTVQNENPSSLISPKSELENDYNTEKTPLIQRTESEIKQLDHLRSISPILTKSDNLIFEGDPDGKGKLFQLLKKRRYKVFKGDFKNGLKEGQGIEYFLPSVSRSSGSSMFTKTKRQTTSPKQPQKRFEGLYRNDVRHGKGYEYSILGDRTLLGVWKNGHICNIEQDYVDLPKIDVKNYHFDFHKDRIGYGSEGDVFRIEYEGKEAALKIFRGEHSFRPTATTNNVQNNRSSSEEEELEDDPINLSNSQQQGEREKVITFRHQKELFLQRRTFARSQKIWSKVSHHPYILELYAWTGVTNSRESPMGYVTERCKMSLKHAIIQDFLPWESKIRVMREVAEAMQYLPSQSIMHRDLKIGNVLLDDINRVKICDFEFSKFDEKDWKNVKISQSVLGTPVCIAPEVVRGGKYSKMCDVYSYGVLVHCLFFGVTNPYEGREFCEGCKMTLNTGIHKHVASCGMRPEIDRSQVVMDSWVVDELIVKCFHNNPDHRPTFDEIVSLFKKNCKKTSKLKGKKKKDGEKEEYENNLEDIELGDSMGSSIN